MFRVDGELPASQVLVESFYAEHNGQPFFSIWPYFFSAAAKERDANATGLSVPSANRCDSTAPTP